LVAALCYGGDERWTIVHEEVSMDVNNNAAKWWLNSDTWVEHKRINQAALELNALHKRNVGVEEQVNRLLDLDRAQGQEIAKLQAVVYTLIQIIVEAGTVPIGVMNERLASAVTAAEAASKS
jgi:hypothetical protein